MSLSLMAIKARPILDRHQVAPPMGEGGTGQSGGREPEEETEEPRDEAGDRESEQKGELEFQHQERGGVGADGHKAGMTEGDLPSVADQEVQATSDDDMNGGEGP